MLNTKLCYVHRGIFRTKLNIYDGAFFVLAKPYFKNLTFNSIEFPLGSIFYTTHHLVKKLTTENFRNKKYFVNNRRIFFRNSKLWNGIVSSPQKNFLNLHLSKVLKLLVFVLFSYSLFQILWSKHLF